jgi:hypothetical protein
MIKNYRGKKYSAIYFLIILFFIFICPSTNCVLAADLEVKYPTIAGQALTSDIELPAYMKYLFGLGMFVGFFAVFVSLTIGGVMYLFSAVSIDTKANARDRFSGAISGLLILVLTYLIITTINPSLSVFKSDKLSGNPPPAKEKKAPGVYFYKTPDCLEDESVQANTYSVPDMGTGLRNKVVSVGIIQNSSGYIPILYDTVNFQGKCQYLNPNKECISDKSFSFAASASVLQYDPDPNGDGVYFYRKSYFSEDGGYYKVENSEIKDIYTKKLDDLSFTGSDGGGCNVPKEEQDCIKYDEKGICCTDKTCDSDGKKCPTLRGENISSVKIKGNYIVLFIYKGPQDDDPETSLGPWTYCQSFPTKDDINKTGPQQIKWQSIRSTGGVIPNYVIIIPIKP